ncbi:hypothetical protein [Nostoc linckia]|nr:hypothetical protein [Nostoc linckia]
MPNAQPPIPYSEDKGKGKGVWFDKLTNRGKGERLNLLLFPFPFNL